ncbi:hypothetical protein P689_12215 [Candidatus Riesia pediculischaeffi PTSU]|uniref:Uncharacterized protein n=1 Tax=Candidatus Riesia pediculischaeffi PTSU TaxID=1401651 RepID=A0A0C1S9B8_9ENTR|nr:hypothetical protein P689_12215 [Candidatus Riesia pediculischaeffi PTSU]
MIPDMRCKIETIALIGSFLISRSKLIKFFLFIFKTCFVRFNYHL